MKGLVKLDELEEVAEPPLGSLSEASSSCMPRDDTQDLDDDQATLEEEGEVERFSLGESNLGLL